MLFADIQMVKGDLFYGKIVRRKLNKQEIKIKEKGKKIFQPNLISWSYLYLGTIALINANNKNKNKILNIIQIGAGIKFNG